MAHSPLLMIPLPLPQQQQDHLLTFYSLQHNNTPCKIHNEIDVAETLGQDLRSLGSSHSWVGFTQQNNPFLLNPFFKTRICLPSERTLPRVGVGVGVGVGVDSSKIEKLILCGDPSHDPNYTVVAMHCPLLRTKIAFCRDDEWRDLGSTIETCYDVVCCDATRSAFVLGPGPVVEVWDLGRALPSRKAVIQGSCPRDNGGFPRDLYTSRCYLALSGFGQMFYVVRHIGDFVNPQGEVVSEGDTLTDYTTQPLVCPYETKGFNVFMYDYVHGDNKWVEVKSLEDRALFVGGNQSMMVMANGQVQGNAIYYTDDCWDRMDEDYSYGGHDIGIFNMEDRSFHSIVESQELRIVPPPVWINVPHV